MISLVKIYREMFENEQKQANDLTKQLDALRAENDALRQKNADLNNQIAEHVKKCLCCENFKFVQEIQFLNHKISELREANKRTDVVSHARGKSLINERDRTAELEKVLKDISDKISEVLK